MIDWMTFNIEEWMVFAATFSLVGNSFFEMSLMKVSMVLKAHFVNLTVFPSLNFLIKISLLESINHPSKIKGPILLAP
jgi:hypothetical protein